MRNEIYVSISCLGYDSELEHTINTCLNNSVNNITIAIAMIDNYEFYLQMKEKYKNVKFLYATKEEGLGIGKSRILAASMYDNEEYFLQIDAHTSFFKNWDQELIRQFEHAKKITGKEKIVLSGYPPRYERFHSKLYISGVLNYPVFLENEFILNAIPKWGDKELDLEYYPLNKISANFMFSNKHLAKNLGVEINSIFWEEEILQSINLIDNNFILLYPEKKAVLAHRYQENGGINRPHIFDYLNNSYQLILLNYYSFLLNPQNKQKIDKYSKYAKIDLIKGIKEFQLPDIFPHILEQ
jgi:hypothetical protein